MIHRCVFRPTALGSKHRASIRITGRDFSHTTFNFIDSEQARQVFETIRGLTCRLGRIEKLYAFSYQGTPVEQPIKGWEIYNAKREFKRQGIHEKAEDRGWRVTNINRDYQFCPTYPAQFYVPSKVSDNVLKYGGAYRSKTRIPALTYLHPVNNCSITRSAQPMPGYTYARNAQDEKLVHACFSASLSLEYGDLTPEMRTSPTSSLESSVVNLSQVAAVGASSDVGQMEDSMLDSVEEVSPDQPTVYGAQQKNLIVDARPSLNAMAQHVAGNGSENMEHYRFATKAYLGIDNIHVMRKSLYRVFEALKDGDMTSLPPNRDLLAKSGWIKYITLILDGSALIARRVGVHHSHVLIHCSDGWDRTSQLSALSQIMLDPYYRTIEGFIVLVEKDWLSFGHMFQTRSGFLSHEKWFVTESDGLTGTNAQSDGNNDAPRNELLESAFAKTKRFFSRPAPTDEVDSDGDPIYNDEPTSSKGRPAKGSPEEQEATKENEMSPVFHQFLDCVHQLLLQHPKRFEFNDRFLRRMLYHLYSCQFGTFLWNSEKARLDAKAKERTKSVWDYFLGNKKLFLNPEYDGGEIDDNVRGKERLIFPELDKVRWWNELYGRKDEEMNGGPGEPVPGAPKPPSGVLTPRETNGAGVLKEVETAGKDVVVDGAQPVAPSARQPVSFDGGASGSGSVQDAPRALNSGNAAAMLGLASGLSSLSVGDDPARERSRSPRKETEMR